jgi:hypothetical protein
MPEAEKHRVSRARSSLSREQIKARVPESCWTQTTWQLNLLIFNLKGQLSHFTQMPQTQFTVTCVGRHSEGTLSGQILCDTSAEFISLSPFAKNRSMASSKNLLPLLTMIHTHHRLGHPPLFGNWFQTTGQSPAITPTIEVDFLIPDYDSS